MTIPEDIKYLYSIRSVRETNFKTLDRIKKDTLSHFNVKLNNMDNVVDYVIQVIRSDYPTNKSLAEIPIHGRFQHFNAGGKLRLNPLIEEWKKVGISNNEICKRLIDLFFVSVLLDAGAGNSWKYEEEDGTQTGRSEGLAIASLEMFKQGNFGDNKVDGEKLAQLKTEDLLKGLQISKSNPMNGFDGRLNLLKKLGTSLLNNEQFLDNRPGNLIDFLSNEEMKIDLNSLWEAVVNLLKDVWPTDGRIQYKGYYIGDVWMLDGEIVTFHKLTQWLVYSLFKPIMEFGNMEILNADLMTGLPEYRNGGLFIDFKVLELKEEAKNHDQNGIPMFEPSHEAIVEWRSCTINLLDMLLPLVNQKLGFTLSLPQLIEAGSWKSGRLIAKHLRGNIGGGPPIELEGDGTVF